MYSSLSWIEWLDRLDRVLNGAREDVALLSRAGGPQGMAAIERSKRQLSALIDDLRFLDRNVLSADPTDAASDRADSLQRALDATVLKLAGLTEVQAGSAAVIRDRALAAIDLSLRNSCFEAANLLGPRRRRA